MIFHLDKATLYWNTLKYLKLEQFAGRLWHVIRRPKPDFSPAPSVRKNLRSLAMAARRTPSLTGPESFIFLGEPGALSTHGWDDPMRSKLWRYNLHYFDDLNAQGASTRLEWQRSFIRAWIEGNPPGCGSGWEPYPTSLRIVNWIKWLFGNVAPPDIMVNSLAVQARWLMLNLERHLLGNHLFTNAKALVFAGCFFEGPEAERWLSKGAKILRAQLREQILSDGGHIERSPMYHALMLEDILDLINLFEHNDPSVEVAVQLDHLKAVSKTMLRWLFQMCHLDGEISFFNDAAFDVSPSVEELAAYAHRLGCNPSSVTGVAFTGTTISTQLLGASGYVRVQLPDACILLDVAPVGPDYLPGHAHADTLSFEMSFRGQRLFINSGTSEYGISAERLRQRGTPAHNTVTVNGRNSSEVWSGFRVARRAYPVGLHIESDSDSVIVSCCHDGYQKSLRPPVTHRREWKVFSCGLEICDTLISSAEPSFYEAEARYHLHPEIHVESGDTPQKVELHLPSGQRITLTSSAPIEHFLTTYHPRFGVSQPSSGLSVPLRNGTAKLLIYW